MRFSLEFSFLCATITMRADCDGGKNVEKLEKMWELPNLEARMVVA